jgi:hypothetical protein
MQRDGAAPLPIEPGPSRRESWVGRGVWRRAAFASLASLFGIALLSGAWTLCPFANLTGHPCPGCGMTRAALALLSGEWSAALRWHPLSPICVPLLAALALEGFIRFVAGSSLPTRLEPRRSRVSRDWLWGALAASLLGVWAARFLGALGGPVSVHSHFSQFGF